MDTVNFESLVEKWAPVLNEETAGPIQDRHRKQVTAAILENQERAMQQEASQMNFLQRHLLTTPQTLLTGTPS